MNPRQSVLIAMFLSLVVYLLASANARKIVTNVEALKQKPAAPPAPQIVRIA